MGRLLIYALGGGRGHATRAGLIAKALQPLGHATMALVREDAQVWAAPADVVAVPRQDAEGLAQTVAKAVAEHRPDLLVVDVFPGGLLDELRPEDGALLGVPACLLLRMHQKVEQRDFQALTRAYRLRIDLEPALDWLPADIDALPFGPVVKQPVPDTDGAERRILLVGGEDDALISAFHVALDGLLAICGEVDWVAPTEPLALVEGRGDVVVGRAGYNLSWEAAVAGAQHVAWPAHRRFDDQHRRSAQLAEAVASVDQLVPAVRRAWAAGPRELFKGGSALRVAESLDGVLKALGS